MFCGLFRSNEIVEKYLRSTDNRHSCIENPQSHFEPHSSILNSTALMALATGNVNYRQDSVTLVPGEKCGKIGIQSKEKGNFQFG
jgi:hypothetical protein